MRPLVYIGQDFDARAGDVVTLTWAFVTNERPCPFDNAFLFLTNGSTGLVTLFFSDPFPHCGAAIGPAPPGSAFQNATSPRTDFVTVPTSGTWTMYVGVEFGEDTTVSSGVLVDNIRQLRGGGAVPEPTMLALLGLGLAGLGFSRRKQ